MPAIPSSLAVALPKATVWIRDAVRADRANAYGLDAPWTLPRLGGDLAKMDLVPPDYFDGAWHIQDGVVTELPFPVDRAICDGCTLSPDFWPKSWGGLKAYLSAIFHDRWYAWLEKFAKAWGWAVERVRKLGDIIFGSILRAWTKLLRGWQRVKGEIACRVYYRGVRAFGGVAHAAYKRLAPPAAVAIAAGALALGGCAGCAIPNAWEDPDAPVEIPAHSYSNLVTGETWSYEPHSQAENAASGVHLPPEGAGDGALRDEEAGTTEEE